MSALTAAEGWAWVAHMLTVEATALDYAWPPVAGNAERAQRLTDEADALMERARELDSSDDLWQRALAKFERPYPGLYQRVLDAVDQLAVVRAAYLADTATYREYAEATDAVIRARDEAGMDVRISDLEASR